MRIANTAIQFALMLAGLVVASCDNIPDPAFAGLADTLVFSLTEATRSASPGAVDFEFRVENRGRLTATACLGPSRIVTYNSERDEASGTWVDHPGCAREFAVEAGGAISWRETLGVRRLSTDRGEVQVEIDVLNPRRCNAFNCKTIHFTSNKREVPGL